MAAGLAMASSAYAAIGYDGQMPETVTVRNHDRQVDKVITITPNTRSVRVDQNDTVRFEVPATGESFVRNFDTSSWKILDLNQLAPRAMGNQHVRVYVDEYSPG